MLCCQQTRISSEDEKNYVNSCTKQGLIILNSLFTLVGLAFICVGIWLLYQRNQFQSRGVNFEGVFDVFFDLGVILIIIGTAFSLFTLFGILGAYRERELFLKIYMGIMIAVLIISFLAGVLFLIFSGKIRDVVLEKMQTKYIESYFDDFDYKATLDALQREFQCCGIKDYKDWSKNVYFNCGTTKSTLKCMVPGSCCLLSYDKTNSLCSGDVLSVNGSTIKIYTKGCQDTIISYSKYIIGIFGGILAGITIFMVINIMCIQLLLSQLKKTIFERSNTYKEKPSR